MRGQSVSPAVTARAWHAAIAACRTFSTFALESLRLAESGSWALAIANVAGSVLLGLAAVLLGVAIGRAIA